MTAIAKQIQELLRSTGNLSKVPRQRTIDARLNDGEYLFIASADGAPVTSTNLQDQNGNPITLGQPAPSDNGRTVVGVIRYRKVNWYLGEVRHLAVADNFRGRGVGTKLMEMVEAKARAANVRVLLGTVSDGDDFAERLGFETTDIEFPNSTSGNDVTVVAKVLD